MDIRLRYTPEGMTASLIVHRWQVCGAPRLGRQVTEVNIIDAYLGGVLGAPKAQRDEEQPR